MLTVAAYQGPILLGKLTEALAKVEQLLEQADRQGIDILCMPEGYLQGYFAQRDLAWEHAIDLCDGALAQMAHRFRRFQTTLILGMSERFKSDLYSTALVIERGEII